VEGLAPEPASRRRFMGMAAGAVALASASAAGCGGGEDQFAGRKSQNGGDIEIVNYALTLEYLESDYYDQVVQSGELKGRALDVVKLIQEDEHEHVQALIQAAKTLKGKPIQRPSTDFSEVLQGGRGAILRTASDLENTGAGAYLGAAPNIVRADILESALAIHTVEGRHAAVLNHLVGRPFLPDGPLATPLDMDDVLPMVRRFTT
jgi:hypothetical protein